MDPVRRRLLEGTALAALGSSFARAQAPARVPQVTIAVAVNYGEKGREWLRAEFAALGWVDGRNLSLSFVHILEAPKDIAEARARQVVASRPDVISIPGSPELFVFQRLTKEIPVVFENLAVDPVSLGLVESLGRPGGNITGTSHDWKEILAMQWGLLKEIRPTLKRGGVLLAEEWLAEEGFRTTFMPIYRQGWDMAAARLGIEIREIAVAKDAPIASLAVAIRKSRAEALLLMMPTGRSDLIAFLEKAAIPACSGGDGFVRRGGLLSVAPDYDEGVRQGIAIVARILRGESPATIPVYQGTRYPIAVNLRTARAMKITIPQSILLRADLVVE